MNDENRKDFQEKLKKVDEIEKASAESIELKQKTIKQEAGNISELQKIERGSKLIIGLYSNKSEDQFNQISDESYSRFIQPLTDFVASGSLVERVRDECRVTYTNTQLQLSVLGAVGSTMSTSTVTADMISMEYPEFFGIEKKS